VDIGTIRAETARMAERAGKWLEQRELFARTVTLKVRYHDFTTITRSHSEKPATRDTARLIDRAVTMLDRTEAGARPVRLLGVSVHGLCGEPGEEPVRSRRQEATLPFEEQM
jgi:DNA polymerase-4